MVVGVFELFKIGIGPSSSHTVGPMRAARLFLEALDREVGLDRSARVEAQLYGSLALTAVGHGTLSAVMLGLSGETPDGVDPDAVPAILAEIRDTGRLTLLGRRSVPFDTGTDLVVDRVRMLPFHPNGMRFSAWDASGEPLMVRACYSVGGGFVVDEAEAGRNRPEAAADEAVPYDFRSAEEMLEMAARDGRGIAGMMLANELAHRTRS